MSDATWIVMGRVAGGVRAFALTGSEVTRDIHAKTEAEAMAAIGFSETRLLRIGDGAPDRVPCSVLPAQATALPIVVQDQPGDILGAWVRLWVAGFLARHQNWDGVICALDGDISHWLHISADEIVSCISFLTPRLIGSLGGSDRPDTAAMADCQSRPERMAQYLRQAEIAGDAAAITGTLLGAELAASRVYWLGQQVGVIAPQGATSAHVSALSSQGVSVTSYSPDDLIPAGLVALGRAAGVA